MFPYPELRAAAAVMESEEDWEWFLKGMPPPVLRRMFEDWGWQAHGGQEEPAGDWRVWMLRAGRGFGKTLAGAQWTMARARAVKGARIALVGATVDEVVKVMIEGKSGLLAVAGAAEQDEVVWMPTQGVVRLPGGAEAFVYSAEGGEKLRGPEHHFAWCDELAKWRRGERAWDNLQMGLRLGERPQTVVTTTPRATALVRMVEGLKGTVVTRGRTAENEHSAAAFRAYVEETYGGTRLGRQELDGELLDEAEGALWTRDIIERARVARAPAMLRIVVGVDPPASEHGDPCGIVVCGLGEDEALYVLADCSVAGKRPEGWARAVAAAAQAWGADRVVAENNQGGDMVESVLRAADAAMPVVPVVASRGKAARAEPVALRFEAGKAKLAGRFPELEDELAMLSHAGGYGGRGSPDRADAMVWALSELMRPPRPQPRVRFL
jgi:phage terminase large subunit-like protein